MHETQQALLNYNNSLNQIDREIIWYKLFLYKYIVQF